jgi:hypothetical protein
MVSILNKGGLIVLIGAIISSCTNVKNGNLLDSNLFLVKTINLNLDDSTSNELLRVQFTNESGNDLLFVLNNITNSVDEYDLNSGGLRNRIYYPVDGPYGISSIAQGFYYHNRDTLFVFPQGRVNGTLMLNNEGEIKNVIKPPSIETEKYGIINHISTSTNPSIYFNKKIFFSRYPLFDLQNPSNINSSYSLGVEYDLTSNAVFLDSNLVYPEFYRDNIWSTFDMIYFRLFDGESYIYSWPLLDHLVKVNYWSKNTEKYLVKSAEDNSKAKPFKSIPTDRMEDEVSLSNLRYGEIFYDKYNELYYRVVYHPLKNYSNEIYPTYRQAREFSILVLDKNFNLQKEVSFPDKKYLVYNAFVGPKGLYLPRNNPFLEDLKEDSIYIDIYSFASND